jgi:RNA polymerase primary sigma factor/RNA polymerase nonessential primary-like sigma factor
MPKGLGARGERGGAVDFAGVPEDISRKYGKGVDAEYGPSIDDLLEESRNLASDTDVSHDKGSSGALDLDDEKGIMTDSLRAYLNSLGRVELLTAEQEVELAKDIEAGLYAEYLLAEGVPSGYNREELEAMVTIGTNAKNHFIEANLRLVVSRVKRYVGMARHMKFLDLIQEGNAGLIHAVEKFDYNKGFKFSTYATWWIRQAVTKAIANQDRTVDVPMHMIENINRMKRIRKDLARSLGYEPNDEDVANELGISLETLMDWQGWDNQEPVSLNTPIGDDGDAEFGDFIPLNAPGPEEEAINSVSSGEVSSVLRDLVRLGEVSLRDQKVVLALYDGRGLNYTEVAKLFNLSRERIRQIEAKVIEKISDRLRTLGQFAQMAA